MSRRVAALGLAAMALSVLVTSVPIGGSAAPVAGVRHEVELLLEQREQAVLAADADAWLATVDEPGIAEQRAQFEALVRLGLQAWSEELIALEDGPGGSRRAHVQVRYTLAGDRNPAVVDAVVDLTPRLLVSGATTAATPPWEIDGVQTAAGRHSYVVGGGSGELLRTFAAELDRASASVGRLLGEPPPRLVLLVPADRDQLSRMAPGGVSPGLAAVTTQLGPSGMKAGPVRILADTATLARLDPASRTAVFGHEAFHVAMQSLGPVPQWLAEGLADYAGYRDSGIGVERAVAGLLRHARANGVPQELPEDAAFADPGRATVAYEGAQLAVRMLVAEYGDAHVIALYREVAARGGAATSRAVREILGTDVASITARWQAEVTSLATQ
jgi:hypothetical protein